MTFEMKVINCVTGSPAADCEVDILCCLADDKKGVWTSIGAKRTDASGLAVIGVPQVKQGLYIVNFDLSTVFPGAPLSLVGYEVTVFEDSTEHHDRLELAASPYNCVFSLNR